MAKKTLTVEQHYTKEGQLKIPLDTLRTYDNVTRTVLSGVSGTVYTIASGKVAYIRQAMFGELSNVAGRVQLKDFAGSGLCVKIPVAANSVVTWDPRPAACGPIYSGIIYHATDTLLGEITLLVQIDPQTTE